MDLIGPINGVVVGIGKAIVGRPCALLLDCRHFVMEYSSNAVEEEKRWKKEKKREKEEKSRVKRKIGYSGGGQGHDIQTLGLSL